jgi:hypothetical protein
VKQPPVNAPALVGTSWKLEHVEWRVFDQANDQLVFKKDLSSLDSMTKVHGWVPYALKFDAETCVLQDVHGTESDKYIVMADKLVIQRAGFVTMRVANGGSSLPAPPVIGVSFRILASDKGRLSLESRKVFFNSQRQGEQRYSVYTAYYSKAR